MFLAALALMYRPYSRQEEWEEDFNDQDFTQGQETTVFPKWIRSQEDFPHQPVCIIQTSRIKFPLQLLVLQANPNRIKTRKIAIAKIQGASNSTVSASPAENIAETATAMAAVTI